MASMRKETTEKGSIRWQANAAIVEQTNAAASPCGQSAGRLICLLKQTKFISR